MVQKLSRRHSEMGEFRSEDSKLSSLAEMQSLVHQTADFTAGSGNWKDRVQAAARALGFGWSRTKDLYYQDARRIDAEEMDRARTVVRKLKDEQRRREAARHVAWLNSTLDHAVSSGADVDRADLAVVQRVLSRIGALDSPLGNPGFTDADENADQSQGWGQ
jgi:hypothetical protein